MRPRKPVNTQDRRDITAGIIAVCLGLLMIIYGAGGDLELAGIVAGISGAFGSTVQEIRRRRPGRPRLPLD